MVTSTGSVYQVGVVGGLDNTARAIKKQIGSACVSAWFFIALATAFRAANSSLILAFTTKKLNNSKAKSNVLFDCVGV